MTLEDLILEAMCILLGDENWWELVADEVEWTDPKYNHQN